MTCHMQPTHGAQSAHTDPFVLHRVAQSERMHPSSCALVPVPSTFTCFLTRSTFTIPAQPALIPDRVSDRAFSRALQRSQVHHWTKNASIHIHWSRSQGPQCQAAGSWQVQVATGRCQGTASLPRGHHEVPSWETRRQDSAARAK